MYKVLLVDDEFFAREALKASVMWEQYGCFICAEAKNGAEGLETARTLQPDIIIADINMPIMNGLTMIEQLKDELPETVFLVLTGYSEFEYAKRGIELGLNYFLMKPVESGSMEETLQKVVTFLDGEKKKRMEYQSLRFWASDNITDNRSRLLEMLLKNEIIMEPEQFAFECDRLELPLGKGGYMVGFLNIDSRTYVRQTQEAWQHMVEEILIPSREWNCTVYYRGQGNLYLLFSGLSRDTADANWLGGLLQKAQIGFMQKWVCTVMAGAGYYCEQYGEIAGSASMAEQTVHGVRVSPPIEKMLRIIHENYGDSELNLKGIASQLFVSYSYLSAQFTKEMGMSASRYISVLRMAKAADAIRAGNTNMAEIAASVGYSDIKYFYHVFKKRYDMTPNQYVDLIRSTNPADT